MTNEPSSAACRALIDYWAKEYERLFNQASDEPELTKDQQIPPSEMKVYIDNYKRWYETSLPPKETEAKLSILKRVSEAWQLNLDTINKLIKYMESTLTVIVIMLILGCQSGLYKVSTSEDGKEAKDCLDYRVVATIDDKGKSSQTTGDEVFMKDGGYSPDGILYDESQIPVEVSEGTPNHISNKENGLANLLWVCTLGVVPYCSSEYMTQEIFVRTPLGGKTGTYRVDAKSWFGWIPIFVGYPSSADVRDANAKLPDARMEKIGRDRLVQGLVGQFDKKAWTSFAQAANQKRKAELAGEVKRVQALEEEIAALSKDRKFDEALRIVKRESKRRLIAKQYNSDFWAQKRAWIEFEHRAADQKRIKQFLDAGKYEEALEFCDSADFCGIQKSSSDATRPQTRKRIVDAAIKNLTDAKRLAKLYDQTEDTLLKDAIVMKIKDLPSLSACPQDWLLGIARKYNRENVLLPVVAAINDKKSLVTLLGRDIGVKVTKTIFEKVADAEMLRDKIWKDGAVSARLAYVDVFGTEGECMKLIKTYPMQINDAVAAKLKEKIGSGGAAKDALEKLQMARMSAELARLDGNSAVARLKKIDDLALRAELAKRVFDSLPAHPFADTEEKKKILWDLKHPLKQVEDTYYIVDTEKFEQKLNVYKALCDMITMNEIEKRAGAIFEDCQKRVHFAGFYVGMRIQEYFVLLRKYGSAPAYWWGGVYTDMQLIRFGRNLRYKLFEKEDGEFWTAFLRTYIPRQKKEKKSLGASLAEAIDDAFDSSSFTYQTKYDDDGNEYNVYRSVKYKTILRYWPDSGVFEMERLD